MAALLMTGAGVSCAPSAPAPEGEPADTAESATIEAAHAALTRALIDRPGVTGVGLGVCDGNPCLKVYVVRSDAEVIAEVAETFEGYPVVVEISGDIGGGRGGA